MGISTLPLKVIVVAICFAYVQPARTRKIKKGDLVQRHLEFSDHPSTRMSGRFGIEATPELPVPKNATRDYSGLYGMYPGREGEKYQTSEKLRILDVPGKPENLSATPITRTIAKLKWSPPENIGDREITNYLIEKHIHERLWYLLGSVNATEYNITDLVPNTAYFVRITIMNSEGKSLPATLKFTFQPKDLPPTVPASPPVILASKQPGKSLNLVWSAPLNDGGDKVMLYIVDMKEENKKWEYYYETEGTTLSVFYLKKGKAYQFRVSACNSIGVSEPSLPTDLYIAGKEDEHCEADPVISTTVEITTKGGSFPSTVGTDGECSCPEGSVEIPGEYCPEETGATSEQTRGEAVATSVASYRRYKGKKKKGRKSKTRKHYRKKQDNF